MLAVPLTATAQDKTPLDALVEQFLEPAAIPADNIELPKVSGLPKIPVPSLKSKPGKSAAPVKRVSVIYQSLERYQACLSKLRTDIETGHQAARQWVSDGGGPPAIHCLAIADLATGAPKLAATRLAELASKPTAGDPVTRATMYAQAAEIWLGHDQPDGALEVLTPAFSLNPQAGDLYELAARVHVARKRWQSAIDAVDTAETLGDLSVTGLLSRARGLKELTQFEASADNVARALRVDPFNLDALVLRGELAQTGIQINANYRRAGPAPASPAEVKAPFPVNPPN